MILDLSIPFDGKTVTARLDIRPAGIAASMRRTFLQQAMRQTSTPEAEPETAPTDPVEIFLRTRYYPDLIAGAYAGEIVIDGEALPWPPTFEQVMDLPEELGLAWENAVYDANPAWTGKGTAEKKASTTGSSG
jgi:hypothetical protein